ncbi:hypothetical protein C7414_102418 [Cupriavidus alkaliphilus]|uniref:hypothetical protein n=1 Tax=Cupriavidus alkaliphilus TaxID=942866 RepID=UPI000DE74A00|nr:hypothetical protein [Cupriavidus alkaliphilus]PVY81089.1 hypothetical protein C7414_102418 [Cupriavidus alkaliphilus]
MSIPGFLVRTAENNKAMAERASLVGKAPIPPGLPSAQEIVAAIDGVLQCDNFYSMAAQDALARLAIVREQFATPHIKPRELADAEEALAISREAHAVMTLQIAQLEKLARELKCAAVKHPHQPLSRWVKFGPMATLLASIKDQA